MTAPYSSLRSRCLTNWWCPGQGGTRLPSLLITGSLPESRLETPTWSWSTWSQMARPSLSQGSKKLWFFKIKKIRFFSIWIRFFWFKSDFFYLNQIIPYVWHSKCSTDFFAVQAHKCRAKMQKCDWLLLTCFLTYHWHWITKAGNRRKIPSCSY